MGVEPTTENLEDLARRRGIIGERPGESIRDRITADRGDPRAWQFAKKVLHELPKRFVPGELVVDMAVCRWEGKRTTLMVVSDRRVMLFAWQSSLSSGVRHSIDFFYNDISTVSARTRGLPGSQTGEVTFKSAGATIHFDKIKPAAIAHEIGDFVAQRLVDASELRPVSGQSVPAGGSVADEIAKLASLHQAGVLSDDEFESQKQRLLNS